MKEKKPILCRLGLHSKYHYLPKVGGDLGEITIACRRCGWGFRAFAETWDRPPQDILDEIKKQPEIEYGRILGYFRGMDPLIQMQGAFDVVKKKFSEEELKPIKAQLDDMVALKQKMSGLANRCDD